MIMIRIRYINEFNVVVSGVLEIARSTTIQELVDRGYLSVELVEI